MKSRLRRLRHFVRARYTEPRFLRRKKDCDVVLDVAKMPYMGYGATIAWLHMADIAARSVGGQLHTINDQQWQFGGRSPDCRLSQFVELGNQRPMDGRLETVVFDPGCKSNLRSWGYQDPLHWKTCLFGWTPQAQNYELEKFRSAILQEFYQPTERSRVAIAERCAFLPEQYLAWHLRRGDKTSGPAKEDDAVAVSAYLAATESFLRIHPGAPRKLVICTDSDSTLEEACEAAGSLGLEVAVDPAEKRWDGYCAHHRSGAILETSTMVEEVLTAQKIVEIFRQATLLVGCNSSYLFRVGAMLNPKPEQIINLSDNKRFRVYYPL